MPSHTSTSDGAQPRATAQTPLEQSCLALSRRLDNTAQVLTALVAGARSVGGEPFERRLSLAASKIAEVVRLLGDGPEDLGPDLECPSGVAAFHGRNDLSSLVDFVSLLSHMGRNGVLEVRTDRGPFTLELKQGHVVYATGGTAPGMRLGDLLVKQAALTEEQLEQALSSQSKGEVLGDLLLRLGLVEQADLDTALTRQMTQLFGRMHEVGTGFDFVFEEHRHMLIDPNFQQGTTMMLLEGARLLDEGELWHAEDAESDLEGLDASWLSDFGEEAESEFLDVDTFRSFVEVLLLEEQLDLVCLPERAGELFALCWREDCDLEQIAQLVEREPVLCAHVLRATSSASAHSTHENVRQLGVAGLRELALALTLNARPADPGTWKGKLEELCRTASIAAEFGALLGRTRLGDEGLGRLLGLMADIGKPAVLGAILDIERECQSRLAPTAVSELIEEYHVEVGTWLARHGSFPAHLVHAIEHRNERESQVGRPLLRVQVALLAQELARFVGSSQPTSIDELERLPVFVEAGLDGPELRELLVHTDEILSAVDGE